MTIDLQRGSQSSEPTHAETAYHQIKVQTRQGELQSPTAGSGASQRKTVELRRQIPFIVPRVGQSHGAWNENVKAAPEADESSLQGSKEEEDSQETVLSEMRPVAQQASIATQAGLRFTRRSTLLASRLPSVEKLIVPELEKLKKRMKERQIRDDAVVQAKAVKAEAILMKKLNSKEY